jgi:hypothetical protein
VNLILAELADNPHPLLYAPLLEALLAAAAAIDSDASQHNTGHPQTTVLPLTERTYLCSVGGFMTPRSEREPARCAMK